MLEFSDGILLAILDLLSKIVLMSNEPPKNPFFNADDFRSIDMVIEGKNQTSQIIIPGGKSAIQLIQILDNGVWIEIPAKCCSMGHTLSLSMTARWKADLVQPSPNVGKNKISPEYTEISLQILGVIEEMESDVAARHQVRIKFRQYGMAAWQNLLDYFSGKQTNLNQLIKSTRK